MQGKGWIIGDDGAERTNALAHILHVKILDKAFGSSKFRPSIYSPIADLIKNVPALLEELAPLYDSFTKYDFLYGSKELKALAKSIQHPENEKLRLYQLIPDLDSIGLPAFYFQIFDSDDNQLLALQYKYRTAIELISKICPWMIVLIKGLKSLFIPIEPMPENPCPHAGVSLQRARGATLIAIKSFDTHMESEISTFKLAYDIAHELGHQALMIYQSASNLFVQGANQALFSGSRRQFRPAIQVFHGAVATAYMGLFSRHSLNKSDVGSALHCLISQKLQDSKTNLSFSLRSLQTSNFTPIGNEIFKELLSVENQLHSIN